MTELEKAYNTVFHDILEHGPHLFQGIYDGENGNENFMYGIGTVMEYIAMKTDSTEKTYEQFSDFFLTNIIDSKNICTKCENRYDCPGALTPHESCKGFQK